MVHEAARHVLAVARVALGHHGGGLEGGVGDLGNGELLVVGLLGGDDGRVAGKHEVDTRVGHQVGLELGHIDVQGGDNLSDEAVQVGVRRALDVQGAAADVVHGLVVEHDGNVGVLQQRVGGQHRVVGLNHGGGDLRGRVHGEAQLGLLAVVDGQALQEQGAQAGARAAAHGGGVLAR